MESTPRFGFFCVSTALTIPKIHRTGKQALPMSKTDAGAPVKGLKHPLAVSDPMRSRNFALRDLPTPAAGR